MNESPQIKSNTALLLVIVIGILLIGASFYLGVNYGKNQETNTNQQVFQNTNSSNLNTNTNTNEAVVSECEINKVYKVQSGDVVPCQCPEGYQFSSYGAWLGKCPDGKSNNCITTQVRCLQGIKIGV